MVSNYTIIGLNVFLHQVQLSRVGLFISKLSQQNDTKVVTISNSTFWSMNVSKGFDIRMHDCYIDGSGILGAFMFTKNCNLSIKNSFIYSFSSEVMEVYNCEVDMQDVNLNNIFDIMIENYSTIYMDNVYVNTVLISMSIYSSLHINHSHFEGENKLRITGNCKVTITDTIVNHMWDDHYPFLNTIHTVLVNISNCTFRNITVLLIAKRAFISIENSSISANQSLEDSSHDYCIDISDGSHLLVSDTNITNNKPATQSLSKAFYSGRINSHLEMYRCLYAWSSFQKDFIADYNSDVTIEESQFINNHGIIGGTIFEMKRNKCVFDSCLFQGNSEQYAISMQSSNVTFTNCVLFGIVFMESTVEKMNNYLEILNCTFNGSSKNTSIVSAEDVAEINIQNSYFQSSHPLSNMIQIKRTRMMRLANSSFVISSGNIMCLQISSYVSFYTFQSHFGNKTWSLTTDETNFIHKADKLGIIDADGLIIQEETAFASSK